MRFEIGQKVWWATWDVTEDYVTCPDCGGTGRLRVTFHDETTVSIECAGCSAGYEPPKGYVKVYNRHAKARPAIITGVEVRDGKTEWRTDCCYIVDERDLSETEEGALVWAKERSTEADREEREKVNQKEKPTRTWAWNAHYHRKEIKESQRRIEYHSAKLAAANIKTRSEKVAARSPQENADG